MDGIDVHPVYQKDMRWTQLPANVKFCWVKVSDGIRPYPQSDQVAKAKAHGIAVGGYHYAQFGDPVKQADLLLNSCNLLNAFDIAPALDLESPFKADKDARDFGEKFCNRIREWGFTPVVYMNDSMAHALDPSSWQSQPIRWIARYGAEPTTAWDIHQFSSVEIVGGVQCDYNHTPFDLHFLRPKRIYLTGNIAMPDSVTMSDGQVVSINSVLADIYARAHNLEMAVVDPTINPVNEQPANMLDYIRGMNTLGVQTKQEVDALTARLNGIDAKLDHIANTLAGMMLQGKTV